MKNSGNNDRDTADFVRAMGWSIVRIRRNPKRRWLGFSACPSTSRVAGAGTRLLKASDPAALRDAEHRSLWEGWRYRRIPLVERDNNAFQA
jgi:hypothetical protein